MKIKYIWEEDDITSGRWVRRQGANYSTAYKICYIRPKEVSDAKFVKVALTDGMVTAPLNAKDMAEQLTNDRSVPLSHGELLDFIRELHECQGGPSADNRQ